MTVLRYALVAVACASVMACGVIPALLLPLETGVKLHETCEKDKMKKMHCSFDFLQWHIGILTYC